MLVFVCIRLVVKFRHRPFRKIFGISNKKYSLSSEIQLLKVGQISGNSENSPDPRQLWPGESAKSVQSHAFAKLGQAKVKPQC